MALSELIKILRCPETRQKLAAASPELLQWMRDEQAAGKLFYKSGGFVTAALKAGLVREDGRVMYPVIDDIPVMIKDEAVVIAGYNQIRMTNDE